MQNVELKIELRDAALARAIAKAVGATLIATVEQTDTYFRVPSGRLKKREAPGEPVEYIFYERKDMARPRLSHFQIYSEAEALTRFGTEPLPVWVTVRKKREIHILGYVRIHIDQIEGLGNFLEFEALVSPSCTVPRCHEAIADLRQKLSPALGEVVTTSYSDLAASRGENL
ncbi:MAG: CYTH domain-containing protein [Planctomycetota bacterium]|nr:CYTH domain-containing protein [Planctomycetota bacterium]